MKNFSLSFLILCFALSAMADPIGKQAALYTAQTYMLTKGKSLSLNSSTRRGAKDFSGESENEQPYYYVFNAGNDGGYVIVSGDDRTEPILGYVEQGTFDPENIPENMRSWLQLYADQIKYIVDNNLQPDSPLLKKRNKVRGTKHSIPELLTTRWNQGKPYNITCPDYYLEDDVKEESPLPLRSGPATGCTATAMAQVMRFYRFPEKTKAIIPGYSITYTSKKNGSKKTTTQKAIPRNTPIDWDNMQDTYDWENNHVANAQDSAVANLMHYCGQAVNMHYGPSSGANISAEAYIKYFGYDNSCYVGERRDYSIDDWFEMLYNEIEQGYPVLFSGFSSGGGHAFVLDGFDGENLFHLNWGWGGGSNGWFLVGILNPGDNSGIGASSSSDGYSMGQRALFNLRLPDSNNADTYLYIKDVSISASTSIKASFENRTGATGSFNVGIVKEEEDGTFSLVGLQQSITSMATNTTQTKTFSLRNRLEEGTYKLSPASKPTRSKEWRPKYNMLNHYIEAVVDSEGNLTLTPVDISNGNDISIDTIVFPGSCIVGNQQEVRVTYRNNGNEYFKEIRLFASLTQEKIYTESRSMVAVRKGETVVVSYFFKPEEAGTYNLWFCTGSDGSGMVGQSTMEIVEESQAVKANLSVTAYNITNSVSGVVYGKQLVGQAKIKNNSKTDFDGKICLQLWNQPNSSGSAWSGPSHTYEVYIPAGKVGTIDFHYDGLKTSNKYYIAASNDSQGGSLVNGGVWDLGGWEMKEGVAYWKTDGAPTGKAFSTTMSTAVNICGVFADCSRNINRMSPNKNPNCIYAFSANMEKPLKLDTANVVMGNHADRIDLGNGYPYYLPTNFEADTATFAFSFPAEEQGTGWYAITMPFEVDSIFLDNLHVTLDNKYKHFWIYEFASQGNNGEVNFAPATILRGNTPYIIAGDATMAGRTLTFRSLRVPFYKSGSDKMIVTTSDYLFHGNTYSPRIKDCYILNEEGTAFEYVTTNTVLNGMESYFTTNLPEEMRLPSIVLPDIPVAPVMALDETSSEAIVAGTYDQLILRRTFSAGWNTICLPFEVENVSALFGEGAKAYQFGDLTDSNLDFYITNSLNAGHPYILHLPNAIADDILLTNITIAAETTEAETIAHGDVRFHGTFAPVHAGQSATPIYGLDADGTINGLEADGSIMGFRAFFELPDEAAYTITLNAPTGINSLTFSADEIVNGQSSNGKWYDLSGRKWSVAKPRAKGVYIINGKKVLK